MPTYQYACTECGEQLEVVQKFTDEPLSTCPACGGRLRKVFTPVGVLFKGSGFYRTDSRASATKEKAREKAKEKAAEPAGSATSPGSSDSSSSSGPSGSSSPKPRSSATARTSESAA